MARGDSLLPLALLGIVACTHEPARPFVAPGATHEDATPGTADTQFAQQAAAPRAEPDEIGLATWYGDELAGHKTANGERFDPHGMTAAHRKLPFGTWVEVRRPDTGRTVKVRINDRGPWGDPHKVIDLSRAAAQELGIVSEGVMRVELRVAHGP